MARHHKAKGRPHAAPADAPGADAGAGNKLPTGAASRTGLRRRDFMRLGALGALSPELLGGSAAAPATQTAPAAEAVVRGAVPVTLIVNGSRATVQLEPRVTLLDALRNHLDLTGTKKVCDRATCGACTVLVDGRAVYACTVLAIEAQERDIRTVEGLGRPDALHPLQAAFVDNDAQQCGFCTPGFVMACSAFLAENDDPGLDDLERGLGGNLCRCGTYDGIKRAVLQAARARRGEARRG